MSDYLKPAAAIILPHIGGYLGSFVSRNNVSTWLNHLQQPSWRPPSKAFGPVWLALYTSMGTASYLVWRDGGGFHGDAAGPLAWYGAQLALNWAWAPVFFGLRSPRLGLVNILALCGGVAGTLFKFYGINRTAGYLMVPYLAWVSLATAINVSIWWYNPDGVPKKK